MTKNKTEKNNKNQNDQELIQQEEAVVEIKKEDQQLQDKTELAQNKLKNKKQTLETEASNIKKKAIIKKEKRERVVSVFKWIFVFIVLSIPIINIFLIIYWGFFSDRINKNIRNFILASLCLTVIIAILIGIGILNIDKLEPRFITIFTDFFSQLTDLLNQSYRELKPWIKDFFYY